jgi:hypothetical protein
VIHDIVKLIENSYKLLEFIVVVVVDYGLRKKIVIMMVINCN